MSLPLDWATKAFADDAIDSQGDAVVGSVSFELNNILVHNGDGPTVYPTKRTITLDPTGHFEVTLPVTDDPDYVAVGGDPTGYAVTWDLQDSITGRRLSKQPAPYFLTVESSLPDVKLRLRTKQAYGGTFSAVDRADGTVLIGGPGVADNGDGTVNVPAAAVTDHGNGTVTFASTPTVMVYGGSGGTVAVAHATPNSDGTYDLTIG